MSLVTDTNGCARQACDMCRTLSTRPQAYTFVGDGWVCDTCAKGGAHVACGHFEDNWLTLQTANTLDLCPRCASVALDALEQATGLDTSRLRGTK